MRMHAKWTVGLLAVLTAGAAIGQTTAPAVAPAPAPKAAAPKRTLSEAERTQLLEMALLTAQDRVATELLGKIARTPLSDRATVGDVLAAGTDRPERLRAWLLADEADAKRDPGLRATVTQTVGWAPLAGFLQTLAEQDKQPDATPDAAFAKLARRQAAALSASATSAAPALLTPAPLIKTTPAGLLRGDPPAYWTQHCTDQGRLRAMQRARLDGFERLGKRVREIHITPTQTVGDYIQASDAPDIDILTFLKGAYTTGYRFDENMLLAQADVEVSLHGAMVSFKAWADAHVDPEKASPGKLMTYISRVQARILRQTGYGVPPAEHIRDVSESNLAMLAIAGSPPAWTAQPLRVSVFAPKSLTGPAGKRTAEAMALYEMLQAVRKLPVTDTLRVGAYAKDSPPLQAALRVLVGTSTRRPTVNADGQEGMVLTLDVQPLWPALTREMATRPVEQED